MYASLIFKDIMPSGEMGGEPKLCRRCKSTSEKKQKIRRVAGFSVGIDAGSLFVFSVSELEVVAYFLIPADTVEYIHLLYAFIREQIVSVQISAPPTLSTPIYFRFYLFHGVGKNFFRHPAAPQMGWTSGLNLIPKP